MNVKWGIYGMKIKSLIGTVFVFYLILMIGFNQAAEAALSYQSTIGVTGVSGREAGSP